MNRILHLSLLFSLLGLTACGAPAPAPTALTTLPPPLPSPTSAALASPVSTDEPLPTPALEERPVPFYRLDVTFDYAAHWLEVDESITYSNHTGETLPVLVLAVEPNLWPNCFSLSSLGVDGGAAEVRLNGQRMEVTLPQPLAPGETLNLSIHYSLALPQAEMFIDPNDQRPRIFGWMARQTNLVNWYPFIVPYQPGQGWILHEPYAYGEHLVYDVADYEVSLRFVGPAGEVPTASSGAAVAGDQATLYRLEKGRAFVFSFSPEYQVLSRQVGGVTVYSYYFPLYQDRGEAVLRETSRALELYARLFGPYPHATLTAVAADFADGMEYSGLYFLSRDFYRTYTGTPQDYLTIIAVHETAHQWWFELVGNDQALEPWLDEALCTYSEHIFYETYYPDLVDWWWYFRINLYSPSGWIDSPVSATAGYEPYRRAIYLNGARFLEELRGRIGDEAFFAFLADYAARFRQGRATTPEFFALLRQHTRVDFSDIQARYFLTSY
ncbi:MAG: M1 family metallopeptidase [Anaerolineales bacterium]